MTQIPSYWDGLAKSSVYYELLDEDTGKLEPIYEKAEFELDNNGKIVYYGASYDGGYSRDIAGGEFLRARHIDESGKVVDVFLHYTQVFQPTSAARKTMDYATTILGVIYQNTNRQLAYMEDYLTQAKRANEVLEKLTELYNRFTVNATNMDTTDDQTYTYFTADQIRTYLSLGMELPQSQFLTGVNITPYCHTYWSGYEGDHEWAYWEIPDWKYDSDKKENVFYLKSIVDGDIYDGFDDWDEDGKVENGFLYDSFLQENVENYFYGDPEHMMGFFKAVGNVNIKSTTIPSEKYYTGRLDEDGLWYRDGGHYDEDHYISAADYKRVSSLDEVLENDYNVYMNYSEMVSIQDQVRAQIDVANNILDTITTMVGVANNDMNQNFTIGTSTLATVENGLKNITINTH